MKRLAKRLRRWEEHTTIGDGISLYEVEISIRIHMIVIVQAVTSQATQQDDVTCLFRGDIGQIDSCRITLILDIQTEASALNGRSQIIHILHHQVPVCLMRTVTRILQCLDEKGLIHIIVMVGSKLTHAVGLSSIRIFIGHRQHLVGLQRCLQRDISQGTVHRIFR